MKYLIMSFLLLGSLQVSAKCFNFIFAGGTLQQSDLTSRTARMNYIAKKSRAMGCFVDTSINETFDTVKSNFEKFIENNRFSARRDKLHISIIAHGSPRVLQFTQKQVIKYERFLEMIDSALPPNSSVTYAAQSCYPRFNMKARDMDMKNIASFCGVTATAGAVKALSYYFVEDKYRKLEFVPSGMDFWSKNKNSRDLINFYYESSKSSFRNLLRNPRTTSQWFARYNLAKIGQKSTITPLKNFIEGRTEFARMSYRQLQVSPKSIQHLAMLNNNFSEPVVSEYINIFKILADHGKINSYRVFTEIEKSYPDLRFMKRSYLEKVRWLSSNWKSIEFKLKKWHNARATAKQDNFNSCNISKDISCPKFVLRLAVDFKYTLAVLRELNDLYMVAKLWREKRSVFPQYVEYLRCEMKNALDK